MDIPPQYGPGFGVDAAKEVAAKIDGRGGAWMLPNALETAATVEPLAPLQAVGGEEAARHEAAFELVANHANVVKFAARGAGAPGQKRFQAPLADPYAVANEKVVDAVDVCLRHVGAALVHGAGGATEEAAKADLSGVGVDDGKVLADCMAYLRDRIGVPRDMRQPAAMMPSNGSSPTPKPAAGAHCSGTHPASRCSPCMPIASQRRFAPSPG